MPATAGRSFARVVLRRDVPLCPLEADLHAGGATVTRLLANDLVPDPSLREETYRLLGKLYDGLIVPRDARFTASDVAMRSGVAVFVDDQGSVPPQT
jgi:hypothetical protein